VLTFWPYVWQLDPGHTYDEHLVLALKTGCDSFSQRLDQNYPIPIQSNLIEKGSHTSCNRELGCHDSCTLCKDSTMYPWVMISLLAKRLEKHTFCHSYTSSTVWSKDHYMSLQRSTTRVSVFIAPARYTVVKITYSCSEVVLWTMKNYKAHYSLS
jgi:hypothetical protein